jgi:hypothetical protein
MGAKSQKPMHPNAHARALKKKSFRLFRQGMLFIDYPPNGVFAGTLDYAVHYILDVQVFWA